MTTQKTPMLNKLTATEHGTFKGDSRGAQLWGVDYKGALFTIHQKTAGGEWSDWQKGTEWVQDDARSTPKGVYELTACRRRNDGCVQFWAIDLNRTLWSAWQQEHGAGGWSGWHGNWNWTESKNVETGKDFPRFKKIVATEAGGRQIAMVFALTEDGKIMSAELEPDKGAWNGWRDMNGTPEEHPFVEITACLQSDNGKLALWGLDTRQQLWGTSQDNPGTRFGPWSGPHWLKAPKLRNMSACQTKTGASIWGIDENYHVTRCFQLGNGWSGWERPEKQSSPAPESYELIATRQNNGCAHVCVVGLDGILYTLTERPGGWDKNWVAMQG
jgi:hypothetical protein